MSLLEDLDDDDDERRLDAVERAGAEGDASLAPKLLELALTDAAEVRVLGGIAEMYRAVGSAAAGALRQLFTRHGYDEPLVRAAAMDLRYDDAAVGNLLFSLGGLVGPLRAALEREPEARLRLRALRAVLTTERTAEQTRHALEDPSPLVRTEALAATAAWSEYPRALEDPSPRVRLQAALELRAGIRHTDAILAGLARETDPAVRHALVQCLPLRWRDGDRVIDALTRALDEPDPASRRVAVDALKKVSRPAVGSAIVARCTSETDEMTLYGLLSYAHLARFGPGLVPFLADLLEKTRRPLLRSAALHALVGFGMPAVAPVLPLTTHADAEVRKAARFVLQFVGGSSTLARVKAVRANARKGRARELDALVAKLEAALVKQGIPVAVPELQLDPVATPELPPGGDSVAPPEPERGHALVVGGGTLPIQPQQTVNLPADAVPSAVTVQLACEGCGARARATAAIAFAYLDDDHFRYQEFNYLATLWTNCPRCAAAWCFEARFTRTNVRGTTGWTYAWDNGTVTFGAALVRTPA